MEPATIVLIPFFAGLLALGIVLIVDAISKIGR
jgi:hypothetical protein